jgi:hypothetical protein
MLTMAEVSRGSLERASPPVTLGWICRCFLQRHPNTMMTVSPPAAVWSYRAAMMQCTIENRCLRANGLHTWHHSAAPSGLTKPNSSGFGVRLIPCPPPYFETKQASPISDFQYLRLRDTIRGQSDLRCARVRLRPRMGYFSSNVCDDHRSSSNRIMQECSWLQ